MTEVMSNGNERCFVELSERTKKARHCGVESG